MPIEAIEADRLTDDELVHGVLAGQRSWFEPLMRRYNQRVYRAARAIVRDDAEAEDVAQEAWVRAYQHLGQFEGRAGFATWLTRIAVNEALARVKRRGRYQEIDAMEPNRRDAVKQLSASAADPEQGAGARETQHLLERSIDALPDTYRQIFMLREVEEMSTAETAQCLGLTEENVKVRLHRARALLRKELYARAGASSAQAFHFLGARCDRLVRAVMERIALLLLWQGSVCTDRRISDCQRAWRRGFSRALRG